MRIVTACLLAFALGGAPLSQAFAGPVPVEVSEVSRIRAREVITNFHFFDASLVNFRTSIDTLPSYSSFSQSERDRLYGLMLEEMVARRPAIIDAIATGQVNRFTEDEWDQLAQLSRIKYVQDLTLAGADPSRPRPSLASMSRTDNALYNRLAAQPFVLRFFREFDHTTDDAVVEEALRAAALRFHGG